MNKRVLRIAVILLVLGAGALAGWKWLGRGETAETAGLRLAGHVEATLTDLSFKVPGKVAAVLFEEGDQVAAGQVVARLEDQDLRQEVAVAEARAAAAEANLAKLITGSRPQDIKSAEAALASARADLADKARDLARQRELIKRGSTAQANLDKAQTAHDLSAEAARRAAESLSLAREGFRREDVAAGRAELNLARATLELARTKLSYATLAAPVGGVVLVREAEPGEVVAVGTPVITLGDLDGIWLEAYLPEPELAKVRLGQAAQVTTDSYPGKRYPGRISFISSKAEFTPKTVETAKERVTLVFRTKIRLDNPGHELKPGMPGEAVIPLNAPVGDESR